MTDDVMTPASALHEENAMGDPPSNQIDVALAASLSGNSITISGPSGPFTCEKDKGAYQFNFTLTDPTGCNVKFDSLDVQDNSNTCPPQGCGDQSTQIGGVNKNNNQTPKTAGFTDNNSNQNGTMNIAFAWNFTCDSPNSVGRYDPIISNGGKTAA